MGNNPESDNRFTINERRITMREGKKLLLTLFFGIFFTFGSYITADAAGITQIAQTTDSITVAIDTTSLASSGTLTGVSLTINAYDANYQLVPVQPEVAIPVGTPSYTFGGLAQGSRYYIKGTYTYTNSRGVAYSGTISSLEVKTAPGKVTGLNQAKWWYYVESVDFTWDPQSACKYEWVAYQGKKQVANNTSESYNKGNFKIKNNKIYTVQVRAYVDINGQAVYGDWSDTAYLFTQPMISNKNGITIDGSGRMKVKWGKISGVTGYEVYVSTKEKTGYKKVASVKAKKGSATIKKFKKKKFSKKKTYFVYIVAKKKVGGITYTSGRHYSVQYKKGSNTLRWSFD